MHKQRLKLGLQSRVERQGLLFLFFVLTGTMKHFFFEMFQKFTFLRLIILFVYVSM